MDAPQIIKNPIRQRWVAVSQKLHNTKAGAIARNFAWLSGDRILRMGLQFLVGAIVARHLGANGFGTLNYAIAITGLIGVFSTLGLDGVFYRDLVRLPDQKHSLTGTVFWSRVAAAFLLYIPVAFVALGQSNPDARAAILISGFSLFTAALTVFNAHFEIRLAARYVVMAANASFLICTACRFCLVSRGAAVAPFAATYLIEPALTAAALYVLYRREGGSMKLWRWERPLAGRMLRESWPLLLSGLAVMVYMRLDQVMLARMRGDADVGIFCAALRLSEVWYFIPMALGSSLFPSLVRSRDHGPEVYRQRLGRYYDMNAGLAYAIILTLAPIAPWIFSVVYGKGFAGADSVFQIHLWACLFVFLGVARGSYLLNEGYTRFTFIATTGGAVINVGLNLIFIPKYGPQGAAWATIISQAASTLVSSMLWAPSRANGWLQIRALFLPARAVGMAYRWLSRAFRRERITPSPKFQPE